MATLPILSKWENTPMTLGHVAFMLVLILVGVVFAGFLRSLPVVSMLPKY